MGSVLDFLFFKEEEAQSPPFEKRGWGDLAFMGDIAILKPESLLQTEDFRPKSRHAKNFTTGI